MVLSVNLLSHDDVVKITAEEIVDLKLEKYVMDESGKRPVAISVIMPTFRKDDALYDKTVTRIIRKCGNLIDNGVIDELLIAEGSSINDNPDLEFIKSLITTATKYCRTFRREVELIQTSAEERQKALQGRHDFSIRTMSQVDPKMHQILLDRGILTEADIKCMRRGKGANLWFSIPVIYGDIICLIDSDIVSFKGHYISGLCKPILETWKPFHEENEHIVFTKAAYIRKHRNGDNFKIGGRLSRLFGKPFFQALSKRGIFNGFEQLVYPFSGECVFSRRAINRIQFSNGYDIETSVLCQIWREYGFHRMSQADFGFFEHIPGTEKHVDDMLREIVVALFYWIKKYGLQKRVGDTDELLEEYEKLAKAKLPEYEKIALENPDRVRYGPDEMKQDLERIARYRKLVREGIKQYANREPKLLRPWSSIKEQLNRVEGYSYRTLKATLQERVNKFTTDNILSIPE